QDFAKRFVNPPNVALAPQGVPELALDLREDGFDVAPLVAAADSSMSSERGASRFYCNWWC
ncbi:MAG TPA: hypothetical protein V6D03_07790, partial [Candidatus Caenarcaniphilales bacterium]